MAYAISFIIILSFVLLIVIQTFDVIWATIWLWGSKRPVSYYSLNILIEKVELIFLKLKYNLVIVK
jgi:hypothetical protein